MKARSRRARDHPVCAAAGDTLALLRAYESRNVTFIEPDGSWPIVWQRARGTHVWDATGRRYLDLTAAFGVAAAGHANPRVVAAAQAQMAELLHAMGDVHPHAGKARLARELSRLTFERWSGAAVPGAPRPDRHAPAAERLTGKTLFCNSGFEAVEAALKTAILATGKPGVLAFTGAYHGTGYGTLNATHRSLFREPFLAQLGQFAAFLPYPTGRGELDRLADQIRRRLARSAVGALLVEPVQGRGGIRVPPPGFLPLLRELCDESGALLILDEVYTGFGRTGRWFGCDHSGTVPDVLCLGKALTGGFPLSACVGKAEVMDAAWPPAAGEAIHTSTFLGHPVGCAMALAQIGEIARRHLVERSQRLGDRLRADLASLRLRRGRLRLSARGLGLMVGLELRQPDGAPATQAALRLVKVMLRRGYLLLPEGAQGEVISFTPPLTITARELQQTVAVLAEELGQLLAP